MRYGCWFLASLLLLDSRSAAAQDRQLGLKAGASLASLERERTEPGDEPYSRRTGLTLGPYVILPVHDHLDLQVEALFTEKGGAVPLQDPAIVGGSVTTRFRFQYMDVPILARVRGPRLGSATLHAFAGPTLSMRSSGRRQTVFTGDGAFGFERDLDDEMKRFDFAATIGAGLEIQRLVVDGRYTHGISEVVADLAGARLRNRAFLMTAGFRIF